MAICEVCGMIIPVHLKSTKAVKLLSSIRLNAQYINLPLNANTADVK